MAGLRTRYTESFAEKNGTLVRFDILVDLATPVCSAAGCRDQGGRTRLDRRGTRPEVPQEVSGGVETVMTR